MEITEAQIEFAKHELKRCNSIPAVAGKLTKHTTEDAEFSDLIAVANRAQMELEQEENESPDTQSEPDSTSDEDPTTEEESHDTDNNTPDLDGLRETQSIAIGGAAEAESSSSNENPEAMTVDEIADASDDRGMDSWEK